MKKLLILSLFFVSFFVNAQTLYWVGGSGYWNDSNHWSTVSGGTSSGITPNSNSSIVFDDNSSSANFAVTIDGVNQFKHCSDLN